MTLKKNGSTAIMRRRDTASDEVFWKLERFKNGGYRLINATNATDWNLHGQNGGPMAMTNNATGNRDDERFSFTAFDKPINNERYSSVQVRNCFNRIHDCVTEICSCPTANLQGRL